MELQKRGALTDRIRKKSMELFGFELSVRELRMLPYIQYTLCNTQKINPQNINMEEMDILVKFSELGYITNGISNCGRLLISEDAKIEVTKDFWDKMSEIIWLGYVELN